MEVTFRNNFEDIEAYINYHLLRTQEGKRLGKEIFLRHQAIILLLFCFGLITSVSDSSNTQNILLILGVFSVIEFIYMAFAKFKPQFYYGKKALLKLSKLSTPRDIKIFQRQKKIIISQDWLEYETPDSNHRWHWNMVDRIGLTQDYIFLSPGNNLIYMIPKKNFPIKENFQEFGDLIMEYWKKGKDLPITTELLQVSKFSTY
jgi:hypothetical protein